MKADVSLQRKRDHPWRCLKSVDPLKNWSIDPQSGSCLTPSSLLQLIPFS